ncbi:MAG: hypothetical protein EON54_17465 [Alcaligenaceae bacterium]|nr:MAG: hypothetical protein EON54_17465 [Alcaligenaceae bacterium]
MATQNITRVVGLSDHVVDAVKKISDLAGPAGSALCFAGKSNETVTLAAYLVIAIDDECERLVESTARRFDQANDLAMAANKVRAQARGAIALIDQAATQGWTAPDANEFDAAVRAIAAVDAAAILLESLANAEEELLA